jgi:hypothetical protein
MRTLHVKQKPFRDSLADDLARFLTEQTNLALSAKNHVDRILAKQGKICLFCQESCILENLVKFLLLNQDKTLAWYPR